MLLGFLSIWSINQVGYLNFLGMFNCDFRSVIHCMSMHKLTSHYLLWQDIVKLVIRRYTREAGVRNLERNLAALARSAAVKVAEQEHAVPLSKDVQRLASPLLGNRVSDGAEVDMEVIPMGVNNHEINTYRTVSPLIVDEAMLVKVLGVRCFLLPIFANVFCPVATVALYISIWTTLALF